MNDSYEKPHIYASQASTKYPNTPESDARPLVMHVVILSDGRKVDIMAADPPDAIRRVNIMLRYETQD